MDETNGPWHIRTRREIYDNPWITVHHHEVTTPGGSPGIYGTVHFKNLAIGVLPLDDDGYTWLVGQHRFPLRQYSWEMPEGGGQLGTDPLAAARRELKEETGLEASRWEKVLEMHLSNSVSDERAIAYVARGLSQGQAAPEDTEALRVKRVKFDDVYRMVLRGEVTDSLTVATVLRVKLLLAGL